MKVSSIFVFVSWNVYHLLVQCCSRRRKSWVYPKISAEAGCILGRVCLCLRVSGVPFPVPRQDGPMLLKRKIESKVSDASV